MANLWNQRTSDSGERSVEDRDSLKLIPAWSIVLAIAVFLGSMYFFNHTPAANPAPRPAAAAPDAANDTKPATPVPPPAPSRRRANSLPMHLIMGYTTGTALASYMLLVGYVSRDVRRRKMPAALWILIVLVMPGGIGAVVYFLLRQPLLMRCPNCTTELAASVHFCPQCQFQVAPVCGQCFRGVQITDVYCSQCGHDVAEDHAPARLRTYSDA